MKRQLTNPNKDVTVVNSLAIYEGGTGGKTVAQAQALLQNAQATAAKEPSERRSGQTFTKR